jgi:hypothetical protein
VILYIDSVPPLALPVLDAGTLRASVAGEVPNMSVTIDNAAGEAAALLAVPPLRARATLSDGGTASFSGRVQSVALGAVASIRLEQ